MEPRTLSFVCEACHGQLASGSAETSVQRICTDSRQAGAGDLFFAIKGERFDGHEFLDEVAKKRITGVVVRRDRIQTLPCAVVAVDDPRRALGRLAARYRGGFDLPVFAVGGSNGKTTTKDLLASVLRQKFTTLSSQASFNNDIGVPLTVLNLERQHQAAVVEVGTNHPGELAPLMQIAQARFGVLTGIGREHLEFFGSLEGVAEEEGVLAQALPSDGKLFADGDTEWLPVISRRCAAPVIRVGFGPQNVWRAEKIRMGREGMEFQVLAPGANYSGAYRIRLIGRHQVRNALLAMAAGAELGLEPDAIRRGLEDCQPPKMRAQLWEAGGIWVLDDSYNANLDSMLAALETLCELPCEGRRVALLGEMAELGKESAQSHEEVGRRAGELGVPVLIAVGKWAGRMADAARRAGGKEVFECADVRSAAEILKEKSGPGDLVLLKASRIAGLERMGEMMRQWRGARA